MREKARSGFTLLEIVVACAIVVAMSAGSYLGGSAYLALGRYNRARADVAALAMAVSQYRLELDEWPGALSKLKSADGDFGPWVDSDLLTDPWGNSYQYYYDEDEGVFAVWSKGPDGSNSSGSSPAAADEFKGDDIGLVGR